MAKTFKGSSSPGQFQNLVDPSLAFDDSERLVRTNKRKADERSNRRKVLADRNRDNQNSLNESFAVEGQTRNLALSNERAVRGQETSMRTARILAAQETANRNAKAQADQSIKARNDIVNLIKDVGGTAIDAYQTFDKIDLAKQTEAVSNAKLTVGASTEDIVKVRSINLDLIGDGERDNEKYREFIALGFSPSQIRTIVGARQDAFYAVKVNSLNRDVKNFWPLLNAKKESEEKFDELTPKEGGLAEYNAWLKKEIHDQVVVAWGVDLESPLGTSLLAGLQEGMAAETARFKAASDAHVVHQQNDIETQSLLFTMAQFPNNPQAAAAQIGKQISQAKNPPGAVKNKIDTFVRAATGETDPAQLRIIQDTFNEWANSKYMGIQLDQGRFFKEFQEAREVIYKAQNVELKQRVLDNKQAQAEFNDQLKDFVPGQTTAEEVDALGLAATKVLDNPSQFLSSIKRWKELNIPTTSGQASFYSDLNNGIATQEKIDDGAYGTDPETIYKLNKKLSEHESGDKRWQRIVKQVESDLTLAIGVNQTDKIKHSSYYRALEYSKNKLQDAKLDHLRDHNGDLDGAYKAMNDTWLTIKPGSGAEAFKGKLRVGDRSKDPNDVGFPEFKGLEGDPSDKSIQNYTYLHNKLKQNKITKQADVLNELTSASNLSEQLIPSSQLKAWLESPHTNVGVTFLLDDLHNLSGRSTSRRELAVQIAESRNMDIPPTQQELIQAKADVIVQEINDKLGLDAARGYTNGNLPRRGGIYENVVYSGRLDASGENGFDLTHNQGTKNISLFDGRITEMKHSYNPDGTGGDGRKGVGSGYHIIMEHVDPETGERFEALYSHIPKEDYNRLQVGQAFKQGQVFARMGWQKGDGGTDERSDIGSTTGPHMSVDLYRVGSHDPYPRAQQLLNYILNRGNQPQQPQQVKTEPIVVPMPEPEPEPAAFNKIHDLPGLPDVKVIESSIGEHGFNVRGPKGQWKQYRAEEGNLSRLKEKYPEAYDAYNEIVNRGGTT